jgi:XTP/dITP diphosphohydrolase
MKKIVLATANTHKVEEFQRILSHKLPDLEFISQKEFKNVPEIEETGASFAENALIKARAINDFTNLPALADDSGLVVEALDNRPGIFSARYAGIGATDAKNLEKILSEIRNFEDQYLKAHFECSIAYVDKESNIEFVVDGQMFGSLVKEIRGKNGFGYDPIFVPDGFEKTVAELKNDVKDGISHRGKALEKFCIIFKNLV